MAKTQGLAGPLVETKLHRPFITADLVHRERLHERLDQGLDKPLILVSAPAGYGKSVLVSEWIAATQQPYSWLSLDKRDEDLRTFLTYFVAAVNTVSADTCPSTQSLLGAPELPSVELLASHLVNELNDIDGPLSIVLDDYHRLDRTSPVQKLMTLLLEHPLHRVRLVLITRRDPPLPLMSMRARNLVTEVRLHDLQFDGPETTALLSMATGVAVEPEALVNLEKEVEGWAAGLRLVSVALYNETDPNRFLIGLHGGLAQTRQYLLDEVLRKLPHEIRDFMMKSSILDRFCADLIEAVCIAEEMHNGVATSGTEALQRLMQGALFTIALDAHGEWFRYHHLFQGLLQETLRKQLTPEDISALHLRASDWFESKGLVAESIEHALAAGMGERGAEIVERHRFAALDADEWIPLQNWLALFPAEINQSRIELLLTEMWLAYTQFKFDSIPALIERIEFLLQKQTMRPVWRAEVAYFKAVLLYWNGHSEECLQSCETVIELHPKRQGILAGETQVYRALAHQRLGQGGMAIDLMKNETFNTAPNRLMFLTRVSAARSYTHALSGDLESARKTARQLRITAEGLETTYASTWGHFMEALTQFHCLQLEEALLHFRAVDEQRLRFERKASVDALCALAMTYQWMQQPQLASSSAEELRAFAEQLGEASYIEMAESLQARLALLQGDLAAAAAWARSARPEPFPPALFLWLEEPAVTQARVRIAEGTAESLGLALETLGALRPQLEALHNSCQIIEVLVLQSLGLEKQGEADAALETLEEALKHIAGSNWIRPFVEAGPAMLPLLRRRLSTRTTGQALVQRVTMLLADQATAATHATEISHKEEAYSLNDLTHREIDILQLLAQRFQNKEIADKLFISTHTVNDHLKHIYQKLMVGNRRTAVQRAAEMGLLDRSSRD